MIKVEENIGRPIGTSGRESALLGEIIEIIIEDGFLNISKSWTKVIEVLAPNCIINESTRNSISYWKTNYEKKIIIGIGDTFNNLKNDIADTLEFNHKLWGNVDAAPVKDIIEKFKENFLKKQRFTFSDSYLEQRIKQNAKLIDEEQSRLKIIEKMSLFKLEKFFEENPLESGYSNNFYEEVIHLLYKKSAYKLICKQLVPLLPINPTDDIKILLAHTYGTTQIGQYRKAFELLKSMQNRDNPIMNVDNRTGFISNLLRHSLITLDSTNKNELRIFFKEATEDYQDIFQKHPHYYPAINYAYTLSLAQKLFPKTSFFKEADTIEGIFLDAKESIEKEKNDAVSKYYSYISEIEFSALMDKEIDLDWINMVNHTDDMLSRTRRKLLFYINTLYEHNLKPEKSILVLFNKLKKPDAPFKSLSMQLN